MADPADKLSIVADGHSRARRAQEDAIRTEVEQSYAPPLRDASWWRRPWIRRRIEREVRRRLGRAAPPGALYVRAPRPDHRSGA